MAAVTVCSDFGAQENKICHIYTYIHSFPDLSLSLIIYKVMKVMLYIS